ncbi:MAG TPA: DUF4097 family beta strand repeat-containing protein [Candidatus Polarisedimenticolaceae bacterium]|nr:DUF4097 family beta strand repeat-containing protein [Candidatus Polarisedimenticolaceae bacterium]
MRRSWITVALAATLLAGASPVLADTRVERELALGSGGRFILDSDTGSVEVAGRSASGVRVVITSSRDDFESRFDLSFDERPGEAEVKVERKDRGIGGWFRSDGDVRFTIEVPADAEVEIDTAGGAIEARDIGAAARLDTSGGSISAVRIRGTLEADTSGGSITIEEVDHDVSADTSGGSIRIASVRGAVHADTSGGGITIHGATGDVVADTSGGSIEVEEAGGQVRADSSGGPIRVSFAPGNARGGSISTSGGGITVEIDPGIGLEIDAASSGGTVDFDMPLLVQGRVGRESVRGTLGSGGEALRLRTSGGGIRILSR